MNISNRARRVFLTIAVISGLATTATAEEETRTWRDKSGKFEVKAKLIDQAEGKVQLLKEDGLAVWVSVGALSDADQQYLKSRPVENPFAGGAPLNAPKPAAPAKSNAPGASPHSPGPPAASEAQDMFAADYEAGVLASDGPELHIRINEPVPPLEPDPAAASPPFHPFSRPLGNFDAYARLSGPLLVDPQQPTYAVSVHRRGNAVDPATFGRTFLVNEAEKQPSTALDIDVPYLLLDHHLPSKRTLALINLESGIGLGGDLLLFEGLASGQPRGIARWRLPGWDRKGFKPKVSFARMLDEHRVLALVDKTIYLWDLLDGASSLQIDAGLASDKLQVSGTGKYLLVPVSKGCKVVDLVKRELIGQIPFPDLLTPEVCFSPDGRRLAMAAGNQFVVWDLTKAAVAAEATLGNSCGELYGWIGERYLLLQLGGLIDVELGMSLWKYNIPTGPSPQTTPHGIVTVSQHRTATLFCMPVPHPAVEKVIQRLAKDAKELMLLQPGTEVAVELEAIEGVDQGALLAALKANIERVGWKVNPAAPLRVIAKIDRGEMQKFYFRRVGRPIGPYLTAEIKPYTGTVRIERESNVVWSSREGNMVPALLKLEPGEDLQQAAKRWEVADPRYFERLSIPARIPRPEVRKEIGRSQVREGAWSDF